MIRAFNKEKVPPPPKAIVESTQQWLEQTSGLLSVEVGCGVGFHPIHFAKKNPKQRILAIERTKEKFDKFQGRIDNHQLPNLLGVHAEATQLLPHTLKSETVDQFFFLYPNPYPKESQKNLRWAYSPFMSFVHECLKSDGHIIFATNIKTYAEELVEEIPKLGLTFLSKDLITESSKPWTHFEKKYLAAGQICWHLVFKKQN